MNTHAGGIMKIITLLGTVMLLSVLTGCTHVISEENRKLETLAVTFESLKENPQGFVGKVVVLGGVIAGVKNSNDGGQIEIVQFQLTDEGYPDETQGSAGRFLATTPTFIENLVYKEGSLITLAGEVKGSRVMPLDEVTYSYPVVSIKESHIWQPDENQPRPFQIPGTNLVDPYYYGHDVPLRIRPEGTVIKP
jgi:outer membrane lipoprotein